MEWDVVIHAIEKSDWFLFLINTDFSFISLISEHLVKFYSELCILYTEFHD
jgi:hypothetical protein